MQVRIAHTPVILSPLLAVVILAVTWEPGVADHRIRADVVIGVVDVEVTNLVAYHQLN